jgi:hypothetical protein
LGRDSGNDEGVYEGCDKRRITISVKLPCRLPLQTNSFWLCGKRRGANTFNRANIRILSSLYKCVRSVLHLLAAAAVIDSVEFTLSQILARVAHI